MLDLATCTRDDFAPHVGSAFACAGGALELIATEPLSTRPNAPRGAFLLRFRARERLALPQAIYRLEHPVLGALEIFLVPVNANTYDAIFS